MIYKMHGKFFIDYEKPGSRRSVKFDLLLLTITTQSQMSVIPERNKYLPPRFCLDHCVLRIYCPVFCQMRSEKLYNYKHKVNIYNNYNDYDNRN